MAKVCDICGDRSRAARDTTATISRSVPGEPGKKGRSEKVNSFVLGELCGDCGDRYGIAIGNLIARLKTGETALPELASPEPERVEAQEPVEHQETLPLGGTDAVPGPLPTQEELGESPEPLVGDDGSMPPGKEPEPEPVHSTRKRDRKQPAAG